MQCPQCGRQVGQMTTCPTCKVATVAPATGDDAYLAGIRARHARQQRSAAVSRVLGRLMKILIPLGIAGALLAAICWPVPIPSVRAGTDAELEAAAAGWEAFQAKIRMAEPANFSLSEAQINAFARESDPGLTLKIGPTLTLYKKIKVIGLPATFRISCAPVFKKNTIECPGTGGALGALPLPRGIYEGKVREIVAAQSFPLKDVTAVAFDPGKVTISAIPQAMALPGGAGQGWQVIN